MALIPCEACQTSISTQALQCPRCGHPRGRGGPPADPFEAMDDPPAPPRSRGGGAGGYVAVRPPLEFRPTSAFVGLCWLAAGLYSLLVWIPEHDPNRLLNPKNLNQVLDLGDAVLKNRWVFKAELVKPLTLVAWILAAAGVSRLIFYSFKRSGELAYCRQCDMQVVARPGTFNWYCERCQQKVDV